MLNFCEFFALPLDFKKFFLNQKNPHRVKFLRSLTVTLEQGISFKEGVKTFYILMQGSSRPSNLVSKWTHPFEQKEKLFTFANEPFQSD
jgi:hypothetical protein